MIRILVRLIPALFAAACATSYSSGTRAVDGSGKPAASAEYQLGPGDQVHLNVYAEPQLSGDYTVSPMGTVAVPLIGEAPAAGLTTTSLAKAVAAGLKKEGVMKHPQVTAQVIAFRPFYILGEVSKPGAYPYSAALTVLSAVATAGGFTYRANTRAVFIKHGDQPAELEYRITTTTTVQPGDTIRVVQRLF
jgi:protein involved in polysaccharide export with SLBB domain